MTSLLETLQRSTDILFIQEPPWASVQNIASLTEKDGTPVRGPPIHPMWVPIIPKSHRELDRPRVMAYIHKGISSFKCKNRSDLIDHSDLLLIELKGPLGPISLLNVYGAKEVNLPGLLNDIWDRVPELGYMGGDFKPLPDLGPHL